MTPPFVKGLFQGLSSAKIKRSALSAFTTSCLYVTVPCVFMLSFLPEKMQYPVFALAVTPVAVFTIVGLFLLFFDRDRLQTEEHLERKHAMEIVEMKGEGVSVKPVDLVNMVSPERSQKAIKQDKKVLPAILEKEEEGEEISL
ncbi:hypothetical protein ACWPKO_06975 [Coraliomargarita sp. W4R53]